MDISKVKITTASGEKVGFSLDKIEHSLRKSGADDGTIQHVLSVVKSELHEGISTQEVYQRAFDLLRQEDAVSASRYKLKKAIYELGPTGYPFEKFIAAILENSGFQVEVGKIVQGVCISHEVDVIARKDKETIFIECKFHGEQGRFCNVKIPLYISSRFRDIEKFHKVKHHPKTFFNEGWVVTNTRFTSDAIQYGKCVNLTLIGWDYPQGYGLKDRIDASGLYPITVSTLLSKREKQFLLSRDIVLCRELIKDNFFLDHLELSEVRKKKVLEEMKNLGTTRRKHE